MRKYVYLLFALFTLVTFLASPANAALLPIEKSLAACLEEINQFDIQLANMQTAWDKEASRIEGLQFSVVEKQAAYDKAREEYIGKQSWLKYERGMKTVAALDLLAQVYQHHSTSMQWSEGKAQYADNGKIDDAAQAVRLAENDALERAARKIGDTITPVSVWKLLDLTPVILSVEKVAADTSGNFGKSVKVNLTEGAVFEARVKLQVRPSATNPYIAAAQTRRAELKDVRMELLRLYPVLVSSPLNWDLNLTSLKPNGELMQDKTLLSLKDLIAEGQLRVNKEILDREFPAISGATYQFQLSLKLPPGINGDKAKLEVVMRDQDPKTIKRLTFALQGAEGSAIYEYQSFTPPIISLSAGLTSLQNTRMRVGESIIRLDADKPGIAAVELKSGEMTAYSSGKLTRKMQYDGKVGRVKSIHLTMPSSISLDSVKLYESGILVMSEEFSRDGQSSVYFNMEHIQNSK